MQYVIKYDDSHQVLITSLQEIYVEDMAVLEAIVVTTNHLALMPLLENLAVKVIQDEQPKSVTAPDLSPAIVRTWSEKVEPRQSFETVVMEMATPKPGLLEIPTLEDETSIKFAEPPIKPICQASGCSNPIPKERTTSRFCSSRCYQRDYQQKYTKKKAVNDGNEDTDS